MSNDEGSNVSRRRFLQATTVTAGTAAVAGQASASESGGGEEGGNTQPDFGGYLGGVDGGYKDMRGQSEVTVEVGAEGNGGAYAFAPASIWVDTGTKVTFEWVNGRHNVVAEEGPASLDSGAPESDATYEYTFEQSGVTTYFCAPHKSQGMKGGVAVGEDIPTVTIEEDSSLLPDTAKALGVAGGGAMAGTLGLAYLFVKYGGTRSD